MAESASLFERGPPMRMQARLGLIKPNRSNITKRAILVVAVGWLPLLVLTAIQSAVLNEAGLAAFITDLAVHARFLIATPLFILAEAFCATRLGAIAGHFRSSNLLAAEDHRRFDEAATSTLRLGDSIVAEIAVFVLAYLLVLVVACLVPSELLPQWHRWEGASGKVFSLAGWWHALVSLPIMIILFFSWMWRLCLWARFLWLMSRLDLRLVPSHPDMAGGLKFVGYSVAAYAIVAIAIGTVLAGSAANKVARTGGLSTGDRYLVGAVVIILVIIFSAPLLVFSHKLARAWRRGVFQYGALADGVGQAFERKWFAGDAGPDEQALKAGDFSSVTDLYQIVSNVYGMRLIPLDLKSFVILVGASLLPFVPVFLMMVPIDRILAALSGFLL